MIFLVPNMIAEMTEYDRFSTEYDRCFFNISNVFNDLVSAYDQYDHIRSPLVAC